MSLEARAARRAQILGIVSLLCPTVLAIIVMLMRSGFFRFHDDFTGFKGIAFFLGWGIVLLPIGTLTGAVSLFINRSSWLSRCAAAANALLLAGFLILLAKFFV